jgi:hypothetical protein
MPIFRGAASYFIALLKSGFVAGMLFYNIDLFDEFVSNGSWWSEAASSA